MTKYAKEPVVNGASISLQQLLALQSFSRGFELRKQRKFLSSMSGSYLSRFRGRGMDFEEVRAYQPGDEVKNIDWHVTARTNKVHTKLFREEKERPVFIITDQSNSLAFGSRSAFKSVTAAYTASLMAWSAYQNGDRVGGIIFSDYNHHEIKPKEGKKSILRYLHSLAEYNQELIANDFNKKQEKNYSELSFGLDNALSFLHQVIRPGSLVFIISDFIGFNKESINYLRLINRHNDIISFFIYDPLEKQAPKKGIYPVGDGENYSLWNINSKEEKKLYRDAFLNRRENINSTLLSLGIPLIDISTTDNPSQILNESLAMKKQNH